MREPLLAIGSRAPYSSTARKSAYPRRLRRVRHQRTQSRKYLLILGSLLILVTGMLIGLIINSGDTNQVTNASPKISSQLTISSEDVERSPYLHRMNPWHLLQKLSLHR
ncbi:MAG: hypothetical protein CM15mP49_27760 [Actinomycetota bacterium]|nr:MAG: hypothetical protein CM15mP49_27760 [Actinomycetota bacterium]